MKKQPSKTTAPELNNWEEVNTSLKRLGELTCQKRDLENKMTELVSEITAKFSTDAAPLIAEMEALQSSISSYATAHKDEFTKERTKDLPHGSISFRVSTSVKIISKAICLKALKGLGMLDFISVKEEPNKDMLKTLDDISLAKVACEKKVVDNISITPKIEELIGISVPPSPGMPASSLARSADVPIGSQNKEA